MFEGTEDPNQLASNCRTVVQSPQPVRRRGDVNSGDQVLLDLSPDSFSHVLLFKDGWQKNQHRYYCLSWQETLFGEGALLRAWGRRGTAMRREKAELYRSPQEAWRVKSPFLLSGIIYCGRCGSAMRGGRDMRNARRGGEVWRFYPLFAGAPKGIRTPVAGLKGLCPGPLDDGGQLAAILAEMTYKVKCTQRLRNSLSNAF